MTAADVKRVRGKLRLTQGQFAEVVGVHPLTVSKWERGALVVENRFAPLLLARDDKDLEKLGRDLKSALTRGGGGFALFTLLGWFYARALPWVPPLEHTLSRPGAGRDKRQTEMWR